MRLTSVCRFCGVTKTLACSSVTAVACLYAQAAEDDSPVIGIRRDTPSAGLTVRKEWFQAGLSDLAFHSETVEAARVLAAVKGSFTDLEDLKRSMLREKDRSVKELLWLLNWKNCGDSALRRGAIAGLEICNPEPKIAGKPLAISAIFEPNADARKASIELIKTRKDPVAARALIDTWKSAFDDVGLMATNEPTRKAAVAAMRDIGDKRVFQALLYYAMLEVRVGSAKPVRVDTVAIKGQNINLPIDLPVLDLIGVEGNVAIPASASLKQATGQDFGRDFEKWREWIGALP